MPFPLRCRLRILKSLVMEMATARTVFKVLTNIVTLVNGDYDDNGDK